MILKKGKTGLDRREKYTYTSLSLKTQSNPRLLTYKNGRRNSSNRSVRAPSSSGDILLTVFMKAFSGMKSKETPRQKREARMQGV